MFRVQHNWPPNDPTQLQSGTPGTPDEVATVAELLLSASGNFITGGDILMDGAVTASHSGEPRTAL